MRAGLSVLLLMVAGASHAVELQLPDGARQMISRDTAQDRFFAPVAPFADGALPTQMVEGAVARSAWRLDVAGLTPLQLIGPLHEQLKEAGFRIVLDCAAQDCGGYDFRFEAEVLPAPNMYVNIRNYHAITALRGPSGAPSEAVTILASGSSGASFIQIIQAGDATDPVSVQANAAVPVVPRAPRVLRGNVGEELQENGFSVLEGLDFGSGTSQLGAGPFDVLDRLAQTLRANPDMRIALVGHTDNIGSLDGNISLSRKRAGAVRVRLIEAYGIAAGRLEAQGMGYLSPHTTNATEAGRDINRRVEAIVLAP